MTRAETASVLRSRLPVLSAFVTLAVLTTMTVVAGVEREAPGRAPVAAPAQPRLEDDASGGNPMAGLIPWASEPPRPHGPGEPPEGLSQNPMLPLDRDGRPTVSVRAGEDRGTAPGKDPEKASPDQPGSTDAAEPTEGGEPVDPSEGGPGEPGSDEPSPDELIPDELIPDEPGTDGPGTDGPGTDDPGSGETDPDGGDEGVGETPKTEPATPVLVYDVGIGDIAHSTDASGVSSLSVPITASSSSSVLTGMVATVRLTLRSTDPADPTLPDGPRAPVTVRSAGGAEWSCEGPDGEVVGDGQDTVLPSGAVVTCQRTYSSEAPAPALTLRVLARGLQGSASVAAIGHVDPNQANNSAPF